MSVSLAGCDNYVYEYFDGYRRPACDSRKENAYVHEKSGIRTNNTYAKIAVLLSALERCQWNLLRFIYREQHNLQSVES